LYVAVLSQFEIKNDKSEIFLPVDDTSDDDNPFDTYDNQTMDDENYDDSILDDHPVMNISSDIHQQFVTHKQHGYDGATLGNNNFNASVELLDLLHTASCPLYMYDKIQQWATRAVRQHGIDFSLQREFESRNQLISYIQKRYNYSGLKPTVSTVKLVSEDRSVDVVTHDFKQCLYSLLSDPDIMNTDNLLVPNLESNKELNDVDSGDVFRDAHKQYILDDREMLVV
jgi:hypothetical protein